ncbi:hypothetical protein Q8A67_025479 [Cirrhinus molitorella]|uniref:Uncharacterized protein n=1 Tax=Cirrhinus molitorella TaxID=172907 RepID=A0AA88NUP9_9TELE|nr:hypothetical protein Q8A67_025479 [Cirrhinus molitorella]
MNNAAGVCPTWKLMAPPGCYSDRQQPQQAQRLVGGWWHESRGVVEEAQQPSAPSVSGAWERGNLPPKL